MDAVGASDRLAALAVSVSDRLTAEQRSWLAEFLQAGERELALEMIADWRSEDDLPISTTERAEARSLATMFNNAPRVIGPLGLCPEA